MTLTVEQLVAGGIAIGSAVVVLIKMGLLTLGRPVERRRNCDICAEHSIVMRQLRDERDDLRADINEIKESIERLEHDLTERMEDLARLIHDHIGYCRGIQEQRRERS